MSSINDSLKNAQQTRSKDRVPAGCPPYLQMHFHTSKSSNVFLVAGMVVIMLFTGFMIRAWYRSGHIEMKAQARSATPAETKAAGVSTDEPGAEGTANVAAAAEAPKVEATVYKLQGVIFKPGRSTVVINGKTVAEGERVDGARVLSITKDSAVILNTKGETMVLDLQ